MTDRLISSVEIAEMLVKRVQDHNYHATSKLYMIVLIMYT